MAKVIGDIMTVNVYSLSQQATMADAHDIMNEKSVRHIPIVQDGLFQGVITQKAILAKVMFLLDKYGVNALKRREKSISVSELVDQDVITANKNMPLVQAAEFFLTNRHGCLPVVDDDGQLLGIVTSSDFVRLSLTLLQ
jgi:CBS domain-containing protein